MNRELGQLLDEAVPEPPRHLDPDLLVHTANRRRRVRSSLMAVGVVLVAAAMATPLLVMRAGDDKATIATGDGPLHLSALDRTEPLAPAPSEMRGNERFSLDELVPAGEASLVATTTDGWQVYLTQTVDDEICIIDDKAGSALYGCFPRSNLLTSGIHLGTGVGIRRDVHIIVAVPDGYTQATANDTTVVVANNVAVFEIAMPERPRGGDLTISGPAVPDVSFHLADIYWVRLP